MSRQVSWFETKPDWQTEILNLQASTAAYAGQLVKARELVHKSIAVNERTGDSTPHADGELFEAYLDSLSGIHVGTRKALQALRLSRSGSVIVGAAYALAREGDAAQVQVLTTEIEKRFPKAALIQAVDLPTIRAELALAENAPRRAIELLQAASPFELSRDQEHYCVYVRGKAFLMSRQGHEAAAEFQKVLNHSGIVQNDIIGALAHLQLGRAYALEGDTTKARAAYEDFLTLWKNADPDIPILKQAKAEYAKLQ
jgi:tetratricopeptide (TPR) repeat protein